MGRRAGVHRREGHLHSTSWNRVHRMTCSEDVTPGGSAVYETKPLSVQRGSGGAACRAAIGAKRMSALSQDTPGWTVVISDGATGFSDVGLVGAGRVSVPSGARARSHSVRAARIRRCRDGRAAGSNAPGLATDCRVRRPNMDDTDRRRARSLSFQLLAGSSYGARCRLYSRFYYLFYRITGKCLRSPCN